MSFLFPYVVTVKRPNGATTPGKQPYQGVLDANETTVLTGIKAHIEALNLGGAPGAGLPADGNEPLYKVIMPARLCPKGAVKDRDVIYDDIDNKFQVISSDWGPLVNTCRCKKLEN